MTPVVVGLGANLDDPERNVGDALAALRAHPAISGLRCSVLVRSRPLGDKPQPDYCNAVALFHCSLSARALLAFLQELEIAAGRMPQAERWASRPLDLDLLAFGDAIIDEPDLIVPHPQITQRNFVVQPWLELDPQAVLATGEVLANLPAATEPGLVAWTDTETISRII